MPVIIAGGYTVAALVSYTVTMVLLDLASAVLIDLVTSSMGMIVDNIIQEWAEYTVRTQMLDEWNPPNREALQAELDETYNIFAQFDYHPMRRLLESPRSHAETEFSLPWKKPGPPLQKPTLSQIARILNNTLGVNMTLVQVRHATSAGGLPNGVDVLADFSSRGAISHRIKPDVLCPGHKITTVKSDGDTSTNQVSGSAPALTAPIAFNLPWCFPSQDLVGER